eukprot:1137031-Pelagomonas_calceolata.AAC.2
MRLTPAGCTSHGVPLGQVRGMAPPSPPQGGQAQPVPWLKDWLWRVCALQDVRVSHCLRAEALRPIPFSRDTAFHGDDHEHVQAPVCWACLWM